MNLTLYSQETFFRYILQCAIAGVCSAILCCIARVMFSLTSIAKCKGVNSFLQYITISKAGDSENNFALDFIRVFVSAMIWLCVSFVANSGRIRFVSLLTFFGGFAIADFTVSKIIFASLSFAMYWLSVMIKIMLLPFITLFSYTKRLMKSIVGKVNTRVVETQFIRYARKRYNDLEKIKQTGMLKF